MKGGSRIDVGDMDHTALNVTDASGWIVLGTGDFNQDGHPDILWHNGSSGISQVWFMNDRSRIDAQDTDHVNLNVTDASGWLAAAVIDFNLDGHPDILWHNGTTGDNHVWFMNGVSRIGTSMFGPR